MADTVARLEPFLLMARSAKGAAAAKIVADATSANYSTCRISKPLVEVELGRVLGGYVLKLASHEQHSASYRLLLLFAYGTHSNYTADPSVFPTLSEAQLFKLKQLTLVSLAHDSRALPYDDLLNALSIPTIRDLEDLIIDSMYSQVLGGRLDQKLSVLHVDWVIGRDVQGLHFASGSVPASATLATHIGANEPLIPNGSATIRDLGQRLINWCTITDDLLRSIDGKIQAAQHATRYEQDELTAYNISRDALCEKLLDKGRNKQSGGGAMGGAGRGKGKRAAGGDSGDFDGSWAGGPSGQPMALDGDPDKHQGGRRSADQQQGQRPEAGSSSVSSSVPSHPRTRRAPQDPTAPQRSRRN